MVNFQRLALAAIATAVSTVSAIPSHPHAVHHRHAPSYGVQTNSSSNSTGNTTLPSIIRGVNIGSWLILESWMTSGIFNGTNATDQYDFDSTPGAAAKLKHHWDTYFTEEDVKKIASWGINSLRIPIGYWAYDNTDTPYQKGADAYMEKAITWARKYGLKVLVDCHGSPGSQNGFDNSGRSMQSSNLKWQSETNLKKSMTVLETMAKKYGAQEYADVVFGIELTNEPIYWGSNNFSVTQQWAQDAYHAVKAAASNEDLMVIMHDSFMTPFAWWDIGYSLNGNSTSLSQSKFALDTHLYQNQVDSDSELSQEEHILKACNWTQSALLPKNSTLPVFVGEFSAQTNICANPNGTTLAGSVCYVDGCQCSSNVDIEYWNKPLIQATRKFLEAELDAFEQGAKGWFLWSYKGPGAWGLENLVKYGAIGKTVTEKMFPGQCGFGNNSTSATPGAYQ